MAFMNAVMQRADDASQNRLEHQARQLTDQARELLTVMQLARAGRYSGAAGRSHAAGTPFSSAIGRTPVVVRGRLSEDGFTVAAEGALTRVGRAIERCVQHLGAVPNGVVPVDLTPLAGGLEQATGLLALVLGRLRSGTDLDRALDLLGQLRGVEAEGARLSMERLRLLYAGHHDAGTVIAVKDVVDLMQVAVGQCCEAAETLWQAFLKAN
jgi:hypothetical protein